MSYSANPEDVFPAPLLAGDGTGIDPMTASGWAHRDRDGKFIADAGLRLMATIGIQGNGKRQELALTNFIVEELQKRGSLTLKVIHRWNWLVGKRAAL